MFMYIFIRCILLDNYFSHFWGKIFVCYVINLTFCSDVLLYSIYHIFHYSST